MRAAPAVQAISLGAGIWRGFQAACHALAAVSLMAWAGALVEAPAPWIVGAAVVAGIATVFVGDRRWPPKRVPLTWDGAAWSVGADDPRSGRLTAVLDLGGWMLVHFVPEVPPARRLWLPLSARDNPAWPALRAAVHARAASAPPPQGPGSIAA